MKCEKNETIFKNKTCQWICMRRWVTCDVGDDVTEK